MNNLCVDIGCSSMNKFGELLCGDTVQIVNPTENSTVLVLADGMGSGVKASILSTLTANIIATMMANEMSIDQCVETVAATLPVCSVRGVAYSTFTIIKIEDNDTAQIIEYDNPRVIFLREGEHTELPATTLNLDGKTIYHSKTTLREGDCIIAMSDGAIYAGTGRTLNFGWERDNVIDFIEPLSRAEYTAKTLSTMLLDECNTLYGGQPGDDTTVCTMRVRRRVPMNLMFGPPRSHDDNERMISLFFAKEGKHLVCGGSTSTLVAKTLGKPLIPSLEYYDKEIPPMASIEGVDLVTEGVITLSKVLTYAQDYLKDNESYQYWSYKKDGASCIARLLFEEATDINFFVGRAVNPAHQNPDLPIQFNIKMNLVEELSTCLRAMGKRIKVSYF